jgi:hypothetical protein
MGADTDLLCDSRRAGVGGGVMERTCRLCNSTKDISMFGVTGGKGAVNNSGEPYRRHQCKACVARYMKDWKERRAAANYPTYPTYKISRQTYVKYMDAAGDSCSICYRNFADNNVKVLDHCHDTGTIRGAICSNCNKGMGLLMDSPETLLRAARHIRRAQ